MRAFLAWGRISTYVLHKTTYFTPVRRHQISARNDNSKIVRMEEEHEFRVHAVDLPIHRREA